MGRKGLIEAAVVITLLGVGFGLCFYYGRVGYFTWDQSIVFDSAWRIMCGQIPWRDFWTPYAVTPALMQIPLFAVFGVNWFAYCLHSALLNGVFCVLSYTLMMQMGAPRWLSFLSGLGTAPMFNTPMGVPHMDQHAYFFCLASLVLTVRAAKRMGNNTVIIEGMGVSILLAAAFFSKQIPTVFYLALFPVIIGILGLWKNRSFWSGLLRGGILILVGALTIFSILGIHPDDFFYSVFQLPHEAGATRITSYAVANVGRLHSLTRWFPGTLPLILGGGLLALFSRWRGIRSIEEKTMVMESCWLSIILLTVSWVSVITTNNNKENSVPFMALCAGLSIFGAWKLGLAWIQKLKSPAFRRIAPWLIGASVTGMTLLHVITVTIFHEKVNPTRRVLGLKGNVAAEIDRMPVMPDPLWPMKWHCESKFSSNDLLQVIGFFRDHPGNFVVTSHLITLYGFCHRPSILPVSTFYQGVTLPLPDTDRGRQFQEMFWAAMRRYHVEWIVVQEDQNMIGGYIHGLDELVSHPNTERHFFGGFTVVKIGEK